jgi:L-iditol 2-dehydrogenase
MKTALLTGTRQIEYTDQELPSPGRGQVRLRIRQCGLCASEVSQWLGNAPGRLPSPIGHEIAGVVAELGDGVTAPQLGEQVAAWIPGGGFAEEILVPVQFCVPVAAEVRYPAVAEPLACVINAVELTAPRLGDDVVIVGAGFMGNLVQLVSALRGPRSITVTDTRPDAVARAAELGGPGIFTATADQLAEAIGEQTSGRGADVTYEVTGVNEGLDLAGRCTRMGGKLCIVGYHQGGPRTVPLADWNWKALTIVNAHFRDPATIMVGMRAGMRLVNGGILDPSRLVTHRYPLSRLAEAFAAASTRPDGFVKAVVEEGVEPRDG